MNWTIDYLFHNTFNRIPICSKVSWSWSEKMENSADGSVKVMIQNHDQDAVKHNISMDKMMEFLQSKKVYRCSYPDCSAYFDRPYRLAQHILAHNNIRPYQCKELNCGKAYTNKSHLDRHLRTMHVPQEKDVVYSCSKCLKPFANRQNLKRHLKTGHKIEFSCELCDMRFKKKNLLSTHMYQHTGIKAFSCEKCSESFVSLYLKKRHMRNHIKMYTCQQCGVEFNHWSKYQKHLKTDHQKYEYICNECGRSFKQRCHLVRHIKRHTDTTPRTFTCQYENCGRSYSRNSNLKQHIFVKHMDVLHECMLCHARLSTKAKLNYHVQLHYTNGNKRRKSKSNKTERKQRKDEGCFKTSTARKLAGFGTVSDSQPTLSGLNEINKELRSTPSNLADVPEELQTPNNGINKEHNNSQPVMSDLKKVLDNSQSDITPPHSTPLDLTVKTEYIEIVVDAS